jgi:hypothetical protein
LRIYKIHLEPSSENKNFREMESYIPLAWIITFGISIIILNFLSFMIKSYIVNQPSGNKSLFVYMVLDICTIIQVHGTLHCSLGILSRCLFHLHIMSSFLYKSVMRSFSLLAAGLCNFSAQGKCL